MTILNDILKFNEKFVSEKRYEKYYTNKYPNKRVVILTCMDTRLHVLLPKALNFRNGDVKVIRNAGALVTHPFGSIMRSLLVSVYDLQADEVFVIGHHDCGMGGYKSDEILSRMKERGVTEETIETLQYAGVKFEEWLKGFEDVDDSVNHSVQLIRNHPLMPKDIPIHGLVIDPITGELQLIVDGYKESQA